jgi:hypothetical protein
MVDPPTGNPWVHKPFDGSRLEETLSERREPHEWLLAVSFELARRGVSARESR